MPSEQPGKVFQPQLTCKSIWFQLEMFAAIVAIELIFPQQWYGYEQNCNWNDFVGGTLRGTCSTPSRWRATTVQVSHFRKTIIIIPPSKSELIHASKKQWSNIVCHVRVHCHVIHHINHMEFAKQQWLHSSCILVEVNVTSNLKEVRCSATYRVFQLLSSHTSCTTVTESKRLVKIICK